MKKLIHLTLLTLFLITFTGCQGTTPQTPLEDEETISVPENPDAPSEDTEVDKDSSTSVETEGSENSTTTETSPEEVPEAIPNATLTSSLEDIFKNIYAGIDANNKPMTATTLLNKENEAYFIGATGLPYTEAMASEAMISAVAHSIILLRFEEGADLESAKSEIRSKIDPNKWICVGVEADLVIIESIENMIIVVVDNNSQTYYDNFMKLK
jgi:hypothetical protein